MNGWRRVRSSAAFISNYRFPAAGGLLSSRGTDLRDADRLAVVTLDWQVSASGLKDRAAQKFPSCLPGGTFLKSFLWVGTVWMTWGPVLEG